MEELVDSFVFLIPDEGFDSFGIYHRRTICVIVQSIDLAQHHFWQG